MQAAQVPKTSTVWLTSEKPFSAAIFSAHHHLVCRACGRTVEVEGPAVEKWADRIAAENGFVEVSHTVEIFGTCQDCAGKDQLS